MLSQSELDELFNVLLQRLAEKDSSAAPVTKPQKYNPENKSVIAFSCRSKRLTLGLGIFAVAKSSGILPSQLREIEDGGDYDFDVLSRLLSYLKLKIDIIDSDLEHTMKPFTGINEFQTQTSSR